MIVYLTHRRSRFLVATAAGLLVLGWPREPIAFPAAEPDKAGEGKAAEVVAHPLDPLDAEELARAVQVLKADARVPANAFFPTLVLREPPKEEVLAHKPGLPVRREAFAVVFQRDKNLTAEAVIDLRASKITSWKEIAGVQPTVLVEEYESAGRLASQDARWQTALKDRGIDASKVQIETWAAGSIAAPDQQGARLLRVVPFLRGDATHCYARPIEGVAALVDMRAKKVIEVIDRRPIIPVAAASDDFFDPKAVGPARPSLPPLRLTQPKGRGFEVRGHEVRWQNWSFRFGLTAREGVVLYTISYQDGKELRPILYRTSLSEMVVPYGDPEEGTWNWRNAFDEGEYGLGTQVTKLRLGHEVPENALLLSEALADDMGKPAIKKDVIALYERDGGMLWTHTDYKSGRIETRRARQLVLHTIFTVGNYDYGIQWIFHQDGSIELQAELTGVMLAKGVAAAECPRCKQGPEDGRPTGVDRYGELVGKDVLAVNHQHFFCFRLDFDVDGVKNSVQELNVGPAAPPAGHSQRNAVVVERQLLRTEAEAQRDLNLGSHRAWKVLNPNRTTALGHFPGYLLQPGTNALPFAHPDTALRKRAGFLDHHVWVTRNRPGELFAAGDYVNQSRGGDGLRRWAAANESIVNEDVVLWYVMGVTHVPRVEEWPVMPVARAGFRLLPDGFFVRNPALDVPAETR
jgi:primary-amine oxidase